MRDDRAPRLAEAQLFYNQPTLALLADTFGILFLGAGLGGYCWDLSCWEREARMKPRRVL